LVGVLILSVSVMEISCKEPADDKTQVDGDTTRTFQMEYDHMVGYDVFASPGESYIRQAFDAASTKLDVTFSDGNIEPAIWKFDSLGYYYSNYWTTQYIPGVGTRLVYKSYLIAIKDAWNKPPETKDVIMLGYTPKNDRGIEGIAQSVIFVQAIRDNYPGVTRMEYKVTIHEMGHARVDLTHLCLDSDPYVMNDNDHDLDDCVMGQGQVAPCTNMDLSINLHFCPKCRGKLKGVTW
jgi:hypothetical protein